MAWTIFQIRQWRGAPNLPGDTQVVLASELAFLRLAIREHRNQTERDFSADVTAADLKLWEVLGK